MEFVLTDEQKLFRDSLRKFFDNEYPFSRRQEIVEQGQGFSSTLWGALAELGVLAMPFDTEFGGMGGAGTETYIVFEALGRALLSEPALSTLALAGGLLQSAGTDEQRQQFIPQIASGDLVVAVGLYEQQSRFNLANVRTTAQKCTDGFILDGAKSVVYAAPHAGKLLITARSSGKPADVQGISVFLVDADAAGISRQDYLTVDGFAASEVRFDGLTVPDDALIGIQDEGSPLAERALDEVLVASCAEAVGAMESLMERTLEHCRTREAFGQPVAKFQVIQHRLVDMQVACEHAAAITMRAARALDATPGERAAAASAARVQVNKEAEFVGTNAVQLHGAMGMTEELDVGHYFKRLTVLGSAFGDTDYHLQRYLANSDFAALAGAARNREGL